MQRHARATLAPFDVLDSELALAVRLPAHALLASGPQGFDRHLVGHDERGVETDAELPDQLRIVLLVSRHLLEELGCARTRNSAEIINEFLSRHANAVVHDRELALVPV